MCRMTTNRPRRRKVDTVEKLAALVVESFEEMRGDMTKLGDRMSAVEDRLTAVESKIAGLHRRIDNELDTRKRHVILAGTAIEREIAILPKPGVQVESAIKRGES